MRTMGDPLDISEEPIDHGALVVVAGEIDIATAPTLRQRLDAVIGRSPANLVVDLLGVSFIDSTGLGALIGAAKQVQAYRGAMRVVVTEPRMLKLFEIAGISELFPIVPTREEAVQPGS